MLPSEMMERQSPDKKLFVTANTTVPLSKRFIFASAASPAITITLPNVGEAEGRKFTVSAITVPATTGSVVHVNHSDGTGDAVTTLATTGVEVEFESMGLEWVVTR